LLEIANRDGALTTSFDETLHSGVDGDSVESPQPRADNPEALLLRAGLRKQLNEALESLPIEFREVLVLRDLEELSYKDIALVANIPIGTVMSRLSRARKLLEECIRKMDEQESANALRRD
jgi:RNA polymerase sigma factor (sigma-70 family)